MYIEGARKVFQVNCDAHASCRKIRNQLQFVFKSNVELCTFLPICSHLAFSLRTKGQKKADWDLRAVRYFVFLTREMGKSKKTAPTGRIDSR